MGVQRSALQGIAQDIAFLEEIHGTVFVAEDSVVIDPLQGACPVLAQKLLPAGNVAVSCPVLLAEPSLLIGSNILIQRSLHRVGNAFLKCRPEAVVQLELLVALRMPGGDEYHSPGCAASVDGCGCRILEHRHACNVIGV